MQHTEANDRLPVAVVTGSSSGIGQATALRLASDGFALVLTARSNLQGVQQTAEAIRTQTGRPSLCVLTDVSDQRAREDLVRAAFAWQGRVDVWVNNAGADVLTTEAKSWAFEKKLAHLLAVDLMGTVGLSRLVTDRMLQQERTDRKPSLINIGWDQAMLGMSGEPGQLFCTTKAAVMAFTTSLAMTVGPQVRVNCVAPGWIKTAWGDEVTGYWDQRARSESLLERWGSPEDVANTIGWLSSRDAEFVNGQCIAVNGGRRYSDQPHNSSTFSSVYQSALGARVTLVRLERLSHEAFEVSTIIFVND